MNVRYGFPSHGMHVIGVTGTNGKTTTSLLIQKMLNSSGLKVGVLSTVANGYGDDVSPQLEHVTTARSAVLQRQLRDFKRAGVEWVVIETSSHSLAQYRVWGVPYEIAVMTNVTYDHLDYHGTFERYLEAKRRLFRIAARHGRKIGVINAEDPNADRFATTTPRSVTYGIKKGDIIAKDVRMMGDYSTYTAKIGKDSYNIRINIPGDFNVSNSLAAVAVGREVGLTKKQIETGIAALAGVDGRMTVVNSGQRFKVIVDFASTPDAFTRIFQGLSIKKGGKLVVVFGSAGRRDEAKRSVQGEIAGRYADEVILTEEDNRDVDGNQILDQIAEGSKKAGKKLDKDLFLILNREEAIGFALTRLSSSNDILLILGKGHEKTIERADGIYPWNEIEITKTALNEMQKKSKKASK